jgi:integrative and conjugative element protein (TIGR02256 family)
VDELEFWTDDVLFGLKITREVLESILTHCRDAGNAETGGILIGEYSDRHDCAMVHQATGPTEDSVATRTRFRRGTAGLQKLLDRLWRRERRYYLGEWHFHPGAAPEPSGIDRRQLLSIARDPGYHCPEPVLVIIGGNPPGEWTAAAYVFALGTRPTRMRSAGSPAD